MKSKVASAFGVLVITLVVATTFFGQGEELLAIQESRLWGFIDLKGTVVIKPQFYYVDTFSEGLAWVQLDVGGSRKLPNGRYERKLSKIGYIDTSGKLVFESPSETARAFFGGLAAVRIGDHFDGKYNYDGKYGYIDKAGKLVIEPQFDRVSEDFHEGLAPIEINKKWGFIDLSRKVVITPQFDYVEKFSEGLAAAEKSGRIGYIDKTGKFVIAPQFVRAKEFHDGMASIRSKKYGDWGYIDKTGKITIVTKYSSVGDFVEGKAAVTEFKNGASVNYCVNKKDEKVPLEDCRRPPNEYPVAAIIDGKKVFIDEAGKVLFENKWDHHIGFRNGVALVFNSDKTKYNCGLYVPGWVSITDACFDWGYIDKTGNYIWKQSKLN